MALPPNPLRSRSVRPQSVDPVTAKAAQSTVTCVYHTNIAGFWRATTLLWCKNLMNHSLIITVDDDLTESDLHHHHTCKIELKPWHFWSKKGFKSFEVNGCRRLDVYWDLRSAKFLGSPEPRTDYYVALVCDHEVVLVLGDNKKKAYKRTKARPALIDAVQFYKKENVFAKKCFSTRARLEDRSRANDIVVECSTSGPREPEMWISVDGVVVINVKNLQWKFRGNQTVFVNKQPVQILWDVHDWLFSNPVAGTVTGHGLFIFKPGAPDSTSESDIDSNCNGGDADSDYHSTRSYSSMSSSDFCLFLYAWKLD